MGCQQAKPLAPPGALSSATSKTLYAAYDESKGPYFRSRPEHRREIEYATQGSFTEANMPAETLLSAFARARAQHGPQPALRVERPVPLMDAVGNAPPSLPDASWQTWTWDAYWLESRQVAKSLLACGLERYEGVVVFGFNAPEWHISQMGITMAGGLTAGMHPTDSPDMLAYKTVHCQARVAIVEDAAKLRKLEEVLETMPRLTHIVGYGPGFKVDKTIARRKMNTSGNMATPPTVRVLPWQDFLALGRDVQDALVEERSAQVSPEDCFAIYYTSGTAGFPRGVMLSHDNVVVASRAHYLLAPQVGSTPAQPERVLSYLPLSHCAAVMFDLIGPMVGAAHTKANFTTYFARPYDLKANHLVDRMLLVRPTVFCGVPRVFEKQIDRLRAGGGEDRALSMTGKLALARCKRVGLDYARQAQMGGGGGGHHVPLGYDFAQQHVFLPLKRSIGLDQAKLVFTGGAPTPAAVVEYFASIGVQLLDTYALSETSGSVLVSLPGAYQFGSCGLACLGNEVCVMRRNGEPGRDGELCPPCRSLSPPTEEEQGELCFRGRTVMLGYLHSPESFDEQRILAKNREAMDKHGWLHSGDKGCVSESGMYRVTGRYKCLIVTSQGASIAPVPIEDSIKRLSKGVVSNVLMVGDKRNFNVALITLAAIRVNGNGGDTLTGPAAWLVPGVSTVSEACASAEYVRQVEKFVNDTNFDGMVCPSRACQVQKFTILPHDFSEDHGDFSTSLKLRRSKLEARYAAAINAMYATSGSTTTSSSSKYVPYVQ